MGFIGNMKSECAKRKVVSCFSMLSIGDHLLRKFWEVENRDVETPPLSLEEEAVVDHFQSSYSWNDEGRFIVPPPIRKVYSLSGNQGRQLYDDSSCWNARWDEGANSSPRPQKNIFNKITPSLFPQSMLISRATKYSTFQCKRYPRNQVERHSYVSFLMHQWRPRRVAHWMTKCRVICKKGTYFA